jgi:uncharacterized protein
MRSPVFFADLRIDFKENLNAKLQRLLDTVSMASRIQDSELVAVKLHFGEKGNTGFIRPIFLRAIVQKITACGGRPFLTDASTLYRGERGEAASHLKLAIEHGFGFETVGAPLIIADGLRGNSCQRVKITGKHFQEVYLGAEIVHADALVSVAHFKCHELTGFGGTLKNLGMGCASRQGKLMQHSNVSPKVKRKMCTACGRCISRCPGGALSFVDEKAKINREKCIGCAECIMICPGGAIQIKWNETIEIFQQKMVEYAWGVLRGKENKSVFVNFITSVSPACDCYGHSDRAIVPDIGIAASLDPVAIDQASADLVNAEQGIENSALKTSHARGADKFRDIYPEIDWELQLDYAGTLGLGQRGYDLITI